jgi:hypothetical protein
MTVHASNLAALDLSVYAREAVAMPNEVGHGRFFRRRIDVIELEHHRIALTAIDARMFTQMVKCVEPISRFVALRRSVTPRFMYLCILEIVLATIDRQARFAVRGATTVRTAVKSKYGQF